MNEWILQQKQWESCHPEPRNSMFWRFVKIEFCLVWKGQQLCSCMDWFFFFFAVNSYMQSYFYPCMLFDWWLEKAEWIVFVFLQDMDVSKLYGTVYKTIADPYLHFIISVLATVNSLNCHAQCEYGERTAYLCLL